MMRVVAVGELAADWWYHVPQLPRTGGKLVSAAPVLRTGGMAANFAREVARLGEEAMLVADVGADPAGDYVMEELGASGVSTAPIERVGEPTFHTLVLSTPTGDPALIVPPSTTAFPGRASERTLRLRPDWVHSSALESRGVTDLFDRCRQGGVPFSVDLERQVLDRAATDGDRLLHSTRSAAVTFVNREAAECVRTCEPGWPDGWIGDGFVVETWGADGGILYWTRGEERFYTRTMTRSAVGAGDRFAAGFCVALLREQGWRAALECGVRSACDE